MAKTIVGVDDKHIFSIRKIYNGVGGILKETVGDAVTGGWYNALNGENIDLNQMTRIVG